MRQDQQPSPLSLEEARRRKGLSRRSLGRQVLASETSIRRWERAERAPRVEDVARLAAALEVPVPMIRSWTEAAPSHGKEALPSVPGLRRLRVAAGLDRATLAAGLGVGPQAVAHWECGRRALPCYRLARLAMVLGMTRSDLIRELAVVTAPPPSPLPALRRIRTDLGLSQRTAAARIGISGALLGRWESGRAIPSWPHLRRMAAVYGVSLESVARCVGRNPPDLLDPRRWNPDDLGSTLQAVRDWRGESLAAVAGRIGVGWATLRSWEQGRSRPARRQVVALHEALGLSDHLPLAINRSLVR